MAEVPRDLDSFDVEGSLRRVSDAVRHHPRLVLGTCLAAILAVTAYVIVWPPTYVATAMVMVERDTDPVRDSFYVSWNIFRKDDARTEVQLMTTAPVLKRLVEREKLRYADVYHPFLSHVTYLWGESWVGRAYRWAKAKVFPLPPDAPSPEEQELIKTIVDLRAGISIAPVWDSNTGRVSVRAPSRRVAAIANSLLDIYQEVRNERFRTEAGESAGQLSSQVSLAEKSMAELETRRRAFLEENKLIFEFQKDAMDVERLKDLEGALTTSRVRLATIAASLASIENELAADPPTRATVLVRQAMQMKRLELQTALLLAKERYRPDSPEIREAERNLAEVDGMIAESLKPAASETSEGLTAAQEDLVSRRNALRSELAGVRAGIREMDEAATALRTRFAALPQMQSTLRVIDRDYAVAQEKYNQLRKKEAQAVVSLETVETVMPSLRVVEYAAVPLDKSWPKLKYLYPATVLLGLVLGVGLAVLREVTRGRVGREDVEARRRSMDVYGYVRVPRGGGPAWSGLPVPGARPGSSRGERG